MAYKYHLPGDHSGEDVKTKDLWTGFRQETTAHGIPHVSNASGACKKVFWLIISLCACGFWIYHLYTVCNTYFQYNTTVKISILQEFETEFPTVTVCNLNPIKRSALHLDRVLEELLSSGDERKKRKKRYLNMDCTAEQIYNGTGLCYGVQTDSESLTQDQARRECNDLGAGLYTPVSADIEQFLTSSNILNNVSFNTYWIYMRDDNWARSVPASYDNYYEDNGDNAVVAVIDENHQWQALRHGGSSASVCQLMVACPNPVYEDATGETYCWFLPWGEDEAQWDFSQRSCERYSFNAHMIELDTEEKMLFLRDEWGVLDTVSNTRYWLGLNSELWQYSDVDLAAEDWSNWADDEPQSQQAVAADIYTHEWSTVPDRDLAETALVICEVRGLQYNGYFSPNPATTVQDTTMQETTTVEETTQPDTTTVEQTTQPDTTTVEQTTQPDTTTVEQTTQPDTTTVEQTTQPDTTTLVYTTQADTTTVAQTTLHYTSTEQHTTQAAATTPEPSSIDERRPLNEDFILAESVIENLAIISEETKQAMGYDPYEFILDCQFEGWNCDQSMFYRLYNPIFGNCYMFNSGWNKSVPIESSHRTGRKYGLSLVLNIGEDEYITNIGGAAGARVIVHNSNKMPHPDEDGYLAKPGELTSIGVRKVVITRKAHPYGNCTVNKRAYDLDIYADQHRKVHYSRKNCFRTCYQRHVVKECGCGDSYYPMSGQAIGRSGVLPCDTNNRQEDDCRYRVNQDYGAGLLGCNEECPDACYDEYFMSSTSTATWPSSRHAEGVLEKYRDVIPNIVDSNDTEKYRRNLLALEIFYDDFNYERIEEVESYKTGQFASDVGGILGLWIGCSVISIFEFFELGIDLIVLGIFNAFRRCRKGKQNNFGGGTKTGWSKSRDTSLPPQHETNTERGQHDTHKQADSQASPASSRGSDSSGFHDESMTSDIPGTPLPVQNRKHKYDLRRKVMPRGRRRIGSTDSDSETRSVNSPSTVNFDFANQANNPAQAKPPDWWYGNKEEAVAPPPPTYSTVIGERYTGLY